jgi:YD repeat-containing protein
MNNFLPRRQFFKVGLGGLWALVTGLVGQGPAAADPAAGAAPAVPPASPKPPLPLADPLPYSVTTYSYDCSSRLTSITDQPVSVTTYVYDANGDRVRRVDPHDEGQADRGGQP